MWDKKVELDRLYHDKEWGNPVFDDKKQFEFLLLESMQCGLSWLLMLKKREIFRSCFADFDFNVIANYSNSDIVRIMNTEGMIKSKNKILAIINNAQKFLDIISEFKSFCNYIWSYSDYKTILYKGHELGKMPVTNGLAKKISKDLKSRGFKYLGAICVYSHLEACGIINDHIIDCPRYKEINSKNSTILLDVDDDVF
ncbi:MAG: DNA-3-methyladenine glycosylase I [Desulfovibrionaceae bacterium]|nr:DNA-3-methyladenine glycosylase I [Desulfovibrionaceae bacterium]